MRSKVTSLTMHKNTIEKRKIRDLAKHTDFRKLMRDNHATSFAFVAFDKFGRTHVNFHVGPDMNTWTFHSSVAWAIQDYMEENRQ